MDPSEKSIAEGRRLGKKWATTHHWNNVPIQDWLPAYRRLQIDPDPWTFKRVWQRLPDYPSCDADPHRLAAPALFLSEYYDGVCIHQRLPFGGVWATLHLPDGIFDVWMEGGSWARLEHPHPDIPSIPFQRDSRGTLRLQEFTLDNPLPRDGRVRWRIVGDGHHLQYGAYFLSEYGQAVMEGANASEFVWVDTPYPRVIHSCWEEFDRRQIRPFLRRHERRHSKRLLCPWRCDQ